MAEPVWQHVAQRFATFLHDLQPAPAALATIEAACSDVEKLLHRWLRLPPSDARRIRAHPAHAGIERVGGYANGTALADGATVDLLLILPERYRPSAAVVQPRASGPRNLERLVDLLGQRFGAIETDSQGWIGIRTDRQATPSSASVRVRVLPAFACATGGALVAAPARRSCNSPWRHLDPAAQRHRLDQADRLSGGKARHLVRLIKAWRNANAAPLSGFAIELLVCEFLEVWLYRRRSLLFYDWMVRDVFFWLTLQAGRTLPVPGTLETLPLGDRWLAAARRAHATARVAADLERDNDAVAALGRWREIFGLTFCNAQPTPQSVPDRLALCREA